MRIISQRYIGDGQFMLQLGGLSSETKPTDAFVATGSQFFEDDTDAVFTFSGLTWNLEKNGQMKDLPVVTATDNGKVLKVKDGVWSVGEDGGESGGGAEKFIVTLTQDAQTEEWTADKTIADIVAAAEANQVVVCKIVYDSADLPPYEIPLSAAIDNAVLFGGIVMQKGTTAMVAFGMLDGDGAEWNVQAVELDSSNAPLIVTMTADQSTGNIVGDKTYQECYTAFHGGRRVTFNATIESVDTSASVLAAGLQGGNYSLASHFGDGILLASGAATDYVTFNLQG